MDETVSYIENKQTKKRIPIKRQSGMLIETTTIPRGAAKAIEKQYAIMATGDVESVHRQVKGLV